MGFLAKKVVKNFDVERQYQSRPSLPDHLPWLEWSDKHNVMLLEDGRSVGEVLEMKDLPCDALPEHTIAELHRKITTIFSTVMPLHEDNPWVLQFFVQDELSLEPLYHRLKAYIAEKNTLDDPFVTQYLKIQRAHFKSLCREQGMFHDPMSGLPFRGRIRKIRVTVYRRYHDTNKPMNADVVAELKTTIEKFMSRLTQAGLKIRRLNGAQIYDWLVRWFNPRPAITAGDQDALLEKFPYPEGEKPFGWSFSQNIFFGAVESYPEGWQFDGVKHKVLVLQDLQNPIDIGVMSRERNFGNGNTKYTLLDKFPVGSVLTIQVVFESKSLIEKHLHAQEKAAVGKGTVIQDILGNVIRARHEMHENNNLLLRSTEAIYIREEQGVSLDKTENDLQSLLADSGLLLYRSQDELYPIDTYLRFLPFNFNYYFDKKYTFRATYKYVDDLVRILPFPGRSRGDGINPLFIGYNRGGEPFIFDHLSSDFKMSNSHMAIIGTTGSGKSVLLNYMCFSLSALYNPHIIVIEVGGSFDNTVNYFESYGRTVGRMKFDRQHPISINPYVEAYKALAVIEKEEILLKQQAISKGEPIPANLEEVIITQHVETLNDEVPLEAEVTGDEDRDILNEMLLATRIMITRGDIQEEALFNLTDITLVNRCLIKTMKRCKAANIPQMLVQHVIETFHLLAETESNPSLQARLTEFAMRLEYYTQDLVRGQFLNHPATPLGTYDLLHIDFGFLQSESYSDLLNIAGIAVLSKILALAQANKATGRPTCLIIDEIHVLLKCSTIAKFIILMAKVARKLGLWLTVCTQNINDFDSPESKKALTMMETWLCLALERGEIDLIETIRSLSAEDRQLLSSVSKHPGLYSEAVLLAKRYRGLLRNVLPRLMLALAMTEQEERAKLAAIQKEHHLTELEAIEFMARQLETARVKSYHREGFL